MNTVSSVTSGASWQLRLFDPTEIDGQGLSPDITLPEFFERYVLPICLQDAAKRNVDQYRESVGFWAVYSGNPPLAVIDEFTVARFRSELAERVGRDGTIAANTVRKHCIHLQAVLDRAGPRCRQNPYGKGLIANPPLIPVPGLVVNDVEDNFTLDEITHFLSACRVAKAPCVAGVSPEHWWQSIAWFDYNVGPRIETLLELRWDWIRHDELGAWIHVPAKAIKKKKRGRRLHLNEHALAALERIKTDRELIFPWVDKRGERMSESHINKVRRGILAASQIAESRRFGFHGFRKALSTEVGKYNALAAKMILGHSGGDITIDHYLNRVVVVEALKKLPQPRLPWAVP